MKVNIGSLKYDLHKVSNSVINEELESDNLNDIDYFGCVRPFECKILINEECVEQQLEQTLLHEITHCVLEEIGRVELNSDEGFVDSFSKQLHFFLKHNNLDKLYSFLKK